MFWVNLIAPFIYRIFQQELTNSADKKGINGTIDDNDACLLNQLWSRQMTLIFIEKSFSAMRPISERMRT